MKRAFGERILVVGMLLGVFLGYPMILGFEANFSTDIGAKHRSAGAVGLGAAGIIFRSSDLGYMPLAAEVINDGDHNVQLGVTWYQDNNETKPQTFYPDVPAGTSWNSGGAKIDSTWVEDEGSSTTADSLYWTAAR